MTPRPVAVVHTAAEVDGGGLRQACSACGYPFFDYSAAPPVDVMTREPTVPNAFPPGAQVGVLGDTNTGRMSYLLRGRPLDPADELLCTPT